MQVASHCCAVETPPDDCRCCTRMERSWRCHLQHVVCLVLHTGASASGLMGAVPSVASHCLLSCQLLGIWCHAKPYSMLCCSAAWRQLKGNWCDYAASIAHERLSLLFTPLTSPAVTMPTKHPRRAQKVVLKSCPTCERQGRLWDHEDLSPAFFKCR